MTFSPSPKDVSSVELVALCINNNAGAWEEFVKRFHRRVSFCALREIHKTNLVENDVAEIVQEVFLRLLSNGYRTLRDFRGNSEIELNAYLFQIVHYVVMDLSRREEAQKRFGKVVSLDSIIDINNSVSFAQLLEAGDESSPDWILQNKFSPQEVQDLLKSVLIGANASRDAIIFYLYVIGGLSAREIAQMPSFSLTIASIQTIVFRTREKLREVLSKNCLKNH